MPQYDGSIRINTDIATKGAETQLSALKHLIVKTADEIVSLRSKMNALKDQKIPTEEFKALDEYIKQTEVSITNLKESLKRLEASGSRGTDTYKEISGTIKEMEEELQKSRRKMQELVDTGRAFTLGQDTEEYKNLSRQLQNEMRAMAKLRSQAAKLRISEAFDRMRKSAASAFSAIASGAKKSSGLLPALVSKIKGMASAVLVFHGISRAFTAMISSMKKGFANFMEYSGSFADTMQNFKNSLATLGNQFAAAFAPIVQAVVPWLTSLINAISAAMTYVAQFIALLGGKSTFTHAKQVQDKYNQSLNGTAKAADKARGALARFDDLDVLQKQNGDTNAGGGSGDAAGDLFEEVPIEELDFMTGLLDRLAVFLGKIAEASQDALVAFRKLWEEGLSLLTNFAWDTLRDFYHHFLVPVGKWVLGEGLPRLFEITNDLLKSIGWELLLRRLRDFYDVLDKLTKFTFKAMLDFYEQFLAPMAKWTMSRAIPELLKTLTDFGNKVSWNTINNALSAMRRTLAKFASGTGEGLILFWKGIEPFATSAMAAAINAVASALQWLSDAIGLIPEDILAAVGGAVGGFLAAFITYEAVTGIMEGIKTAWVAFYVAVDDGMKILAANPYLAAAAGISAIIGALIALEEKAAERNQIERYGQTLDSLCASINNQSEAIEKRSESIKNYVDDSGAAELMLAGNLADRYYDLSQKEYLTNAQKEEMKALSERLVELLPELAGSIDEETGMLSAQKEEIYNLIEAKREQYRLEAAKEQIIEAYRNQLEAEQNLKNATELATDAQNRYNEEFAHYNEELERYRANPIEYADPEPTAQHVIEARNNWRDLTAEVEAAAEAFDSTQESIEYLEKVLESGGRDCTDGFIKGYETEAMVGTVRDSAQACIDAFRETNDSHSPSKVYEQLAKDSVDGFVLGIRGNMASALTVIQEWCDSMKETFAVGLAESVAWFLQEIQLSFSDTWTAVEENTIKAWEELRDLIQISLKLISTDILMALTAVNETFFVKWTELLNQSRMTWIELRDLIRKSLELLNADILDVMFHLNINWKSGWNQLVVKTRVACQEIVSAVSVMDDQIQAMCQSMIAAIDAVKAAASSLGGISGGGVVPAVSVSAFSMGNIPALASGSVIRGGNPFMAILGDQPRGQVNVEAPAGLIKDMVKQGIAEAGTGNERVPVTINLNYDGETFARLSISDILSELGRQGYDVDVLGVT